MTTKDIATLIKQEVQKPTPDSENATALATTSDTQLSETQQVDLSLTSSSLWDESKALLAEFIAFDQEHQLSQKVGAQLWRLTKAVGKPALILSFKGIQSAIVTIADPESRAALMERFNRSDIAKEKEASLSPTDD